MSQISIKSKSGKVYSYDKKQILLDTDLYEDIKKISRKTNMTMSEVIRQMHKPGKLEDALTNILSDFYLESLSGDLTKNYIRTIVEHHLKD
jgi:replication initiation and membrane attachment protein DnaB